MASKDGMGLILFFNVYPRSYMYLAMTLSKLDDFDNACNAYEKAIEMESDHLFHLNYGAAMFQTDAPSSIMNDDPCDFF